MNLPVLKCILLAFPVVLCFQKGSCQNISFTEVSTGISYLQEPVAIGDIDRDLDYDIVVGGEIYLNNAGAFSYYTTVGDNIYATSLGDFDNDNDLDIALAGDPMGGDGGTIFKCSQDAFDDPYFELFSSFSGYFYSDVKWIDIDNDGDLDLYTNGFFSIVGGTNLFSELYKFEGGAFSEISQDIPPIYNGSIDVVDFNHDSYSDMLITGIDGFDNSNTFLAENQQNSNFTVDYSIGIPGVRYGGVICEDFSNNGQLDIFVFGEPLGNEAYLYVQMGGKLIRFPHNFQSHTEVNCDAGDINLDGKLDIVITTGENAPSGFYTRVYLSEGFSYNSMVYSSSYGMARLLDYDNDNDLDIFQGGTILENNITKTNSNPLPPDNCYARTTVRGVKLHWSGATDDITPVKSLKYNIRLGTTLSGHQVRSASAHSSGKIYLPDGNFINDTFLIINDLDPGVYYWSVQSIDQSRSASYFSPIYTFTVPANTFSLHTELDIFSGFAGYNQVWADTDNDEDYDLVLFSNLDGYNLLYYTNIDDTLTNAATNISDLRKGKGCFADLNNDNIPDFILTGLVNTSMRKTAVYLGNNTEFTLLTDTLAGLAGGTVLCADFNNTGKQDIFISGSDTSGAWIAYILRNNLPYSLDSLPFTVAGMMIRKADAFDIDKDNDIDLVVSGKKSSDNSPLTQVLLNNGNYSFQPLKEIYMYGEVRIADINKNDSSDIVISGKDYYENNWCKVYYNNRLNFDIITQLSAFSEGTLELGDYNNNGYYDILMSGKGITKRTTIYDNIDGTEFNEKEDVPGIRGYISTFSDFDTDGDLDIMISGNVMTEDKTDMFRNNLNVENFSPEAPAGLSYEQQEFDILLDWNPAYDDKSPEGLTYNLRVGTVSGGCDIISPLSRTDNGFRMIQEQGNTGLNTSWTIKGLEEGTYYWSVQAVDQGYLGGEWAVQQTFNVSRAYVDFSTDTVCLGHQTTFTNQSSLMTGTVTGYNWDFGDGGTSSLENPVYTYSLADTFNVTLTLYTETDEFGRTKEVVIKPAPVAGFSYEYVTTGGDVTGFENTSDTAGLEISEWLWDFGDSTYYSGKNAPQHAYLSTGNYTAWLKAVSINGCMDSTSREIAICEHFLQAPELYVFGPNVWYFACSNDSALYYRWYLNDSIISGANTFLYVANQQAGEYYAEISNDNTCFFATERIVIPEDFAVLDEVEVFPVPATDRVIININNEISGEFGITVLNSFGKVVAQDRYVKENNIFTGEFNFSGYNSGLYFIEVMFEGRKITKKIIINRKN